MSPEDKAAIDFLTECLKEIGHPKILIVDDNPNDVTLHLSVLEKFECEVVVARSAEEAVQLIHDDGIDLILLDVRLPRHPADDVIAVAAGLMPDANIIVVTGYPDSATRSLVIKKGAKLILSKPLTEAALSVILHRKPPSNEHGRTG